MTLDDLLPLALPLAAAGAAALVLVVDAFLPTARGRIVGWLTAVLLAGLLVASFALGDGVHGRAMGGAYVGDAWSDFLQRVALGAALLATLGSMDWLSRVAARRQGEYYLLLLLATVGLLVLPGARDLILLVVCFELMGVPLYVLAAYAKTDGVRAAGAPRSTAAEAALKQYLTGAASTATTLFGLSFVVGLGGTSSIEALQTAPSSSLTLVGWLLVLAGLAFKIGLPPFHMWIPDTYQGAPTPFVAYLSVAPKAGAVGVIALLAGRAMPDGTWTLAVIVLSVIGMTVGNLMALPQTDSRRLLAYSGIAQLGYVMVAVAVGALGVPMALFYLVAYLFTNMGVFFVVQAVAESRGVEGQGYAIGDLAGLARRSPALALALLVFLLSLAGIPFAVGFWAKLYVFFAAYAAGLVWLVAIGALLAIVALFYYLQMARAAYMVEPEGAERERVAVGAPLALAITVCFVGVLAFGLWPGPLLDAAIAASGALLTP